MAASLDIQIKDGTYLEFSSQLPKCGSGNCKRSPVFNMMGNQWSFYLTLDSRNGTGEMYYYIEINCKNKSFFKTFRIDFRVGFVNEENLTLGEGSVEVNSSPHRFWEIPATTLQSKLPPGYRTDTLVNVIKFEFRFLLTCGPALKLLSGHQWIRKHDKCVQTSSCLNLNTNLQGEGLSKDFAKLLNAGMNQDAAVMCGKYSIKVHKLVLSARSDVFKAMLQSDMQEGRAGIIKLQDFDERYFQDFVKYLYTDTLPKMTFDKAVALYEAGDKYAIKSLMLRCSEYLQDNLSQENAFQCFALADAHSDRKLQGSIVSYILEKKMYLQKELWLPFCENYPKVAFEVYRFLQKK